MRSIALILASLLAVGCRSAGPPKAASPPPLRPGFIAHRPAQAIQPVEGGPIPCYTIADKHEALGGAAAYAPESEETKLDDPRGGLVRRYIARESTAGSCMAPGTLKSTDFKAAIFWSARTCAHIVRGAVLLAWEQQGGHAGELGYPITDELPRNEGGVRQFFENAEITWTAIEGVVVKRSRGDHAIQ